MPKFNMGWLYALIIFTLILLFFTDNGSSLTSSAVGSTTQKATFTKFKEYVDSGYANKVEVNTAEKTMKMYVKSKHVRDVFNMTAEQTGPNPYVTVQFGSVDELEKYLTAKQQEGKIVDFSYENKSGSALERFLVNWGGLILLLVLMYFIFGRLGNGIGGGMFNVGKSKAKLYE